ncbi:flagellar filament capping protein FliD [Marinimicrobium alkaliphilum]|uniref:flagellar filament capping protein FliD n=1 Tax=Marinimicrobium alkaliphilum TaxID=2202654 RepID=UPI000DB98700|nr:flagellar filament capping protein FliD [Marinimicrobium alkaliphilum]
MATNIGSDIVNQIGGGSGINTRSLVDQLVELERAPEERRLDQRDQRLESQISGLGMMRGAMDDMDSVLAILSDPDTFNAKQASISDTSLIAVNALEPNAVPGNYRLRIEQVAQSQSMNSGAFGSTSEPIGEGSLTIRFGSWDAGSFTLDPDAEGATIEIDDSNNTLSGLRDAINGAGIGVQASIVGQAGSYSLLLTSPTGETKEMEITADEGATPGLSAFNFNEDNQAMTQNQAGQDAILSVNGLQVTRSTNAISDVIDGVEFDIFNANPAEEIVINISEDRAQAEETIRAFVETYNEFYEKIRFLTDREAGEDGQGSLANDPLANNLLRSLQSTLASPVPGITDSFNLLANIGIRTKTDGTLEIIEDGQATGFRNALNNNFEQVRDLFVPKMSSSSSRVMVEDFGNRTQPGDYEVEITQQASRGYLLAGPIAEGFPLDTTGKDYSFDVAVNGRQAETITLPEGRTYDSAQDLAAEIQTLINSDATLRAANVRVSVTVDNDTGGLHIESATYGQDSRVDILSVGADMADLGIEAAAGTVGENVQGTINGVAAFGFGQFLRGAIGSPSEGLSLRIAQGATSANVSFSRGFGSMVSTMMDTYARSSGLISERENNLRREQTEVSDARERLERRSEAFRARQEAQFRAMEQIVRSLNNTGDFLEGLNDRLPFTAPNRR